MMMIIVNMMTEDHTQDLQEDVHIPGAEGSLLLALILLNFKTFPILSTAVLDLVVEDLIREVAGNNFILILYRISKHQQIFYIFTFLEIHNLKK